MSKQATVEMGSVSPETVQRLEREAKRNESAGVGDLLPIIEANVGSEIASAEKERDALVVKVRALNLRIATLRTHQLVGRNGEEPTYEQETPR